MHNSVFADKAYFTFPKEHSLDVLESLIPVIECAGGYRETESYYRFQNGGGVMVASKYSVLCVQASGQALAQMRVASLFGEFLMRVSDHPHRVTKLHATLDIEEPAAPAIQRLHRRTQQHGCRLSRKRIPPEKCKGLLGKGMHGVETGTVYLNGHKAEVSAKVYDKEQERYDNAREMIGPCLRIEVELSNKVGISLRDVYNPESVFYHYASPALVERPPGVSPFHPGGLGFELPKREHLLPAQQLMRLLESSPDIQRAQQLAEQVGPHGMDLVYRYFDRQLNQVPIAAPDSAQMSPHPPG